MEIKGVKFGSAIKSKELKTCVAELMQAYTHDNKRISEVQGNISRIGEYVFLICACLPNGTRIHAVTGRKDVAFCVNGGLYDTKEPKYTMKGPKVEETIAELERIYETAELTEQYREYEREEALQVLHEELDQVLQGRITKPTVIATSAHVVLLRLQMPYDMKRNVTVQVHCALTHDSMLVKTNENNNPEECHLIVGTGVIDAFIKLSER